MAAKCSSRSFQTAWTNDFGFVKRGDRAICSLCCEHVVCRTSSVRRHFETKHEKKFKDEADRAESIRRAVAKYEKQSVLFKGLSNTRTLATQASFKLSECIAKHGKPFTDGEYLKDTFLSSADILFDGLPNKETIISRIKDLPASARTVERRISLMAENICSQQSDGLTDAPVFSVAVDESVDINDIPRLAVVARYCGGTRMREELFCLRPMYDTTRGEDVARAFTDHFNKKKIDMKKIFAITTDGAPSMVGKQKGFVSLIESQIGHPVMKFHCIIHQENLCAKISHSDLSAVMNTVVKIVNYLIARSSLIHRQFRTLLEEMESVYKDLPLHCPVRWLSGGKVLERFVECFDAIHTFLKEKGLHYPELEDEQWLVKLMFLTDITRHLNTLNRQLQGAGQTVLALFDAWKAFLEKIKVFSRDIQTGSFRYFSHLKSLSSRQAVNPDAIIQYVEGLELEFSTRFRDFEQNGPLFSFLIHPEHFEEKDLSLPQFEWMGIDEFEMQHIEFKTSLLWTCKFTELRKKLENPDTDQAASIVACWESLPEKFVCLKKVAFALISAFGSTYMCEQIFSHMKTVLSPSRSRLTTDNSEACVQLKVTSYRPDIAQLSREIQAQGSH